MTAVEAKLRAYLEQLTIDLKRTHERARNAEERGHEPIAIVSMSCRFPGGVCSPEDLWEVLVEGQDAISGFPQDRGWDLHALEVASERPVHEGGFVYDADRFDPAFFGISPRETLALDPQQRLLLETSWEAFERAGIAHGSLQGSRTGTFVGIFDNDYSARLVESPAEWQDLKDYVGTGGATSVASGRIAYTYGLQGPAISMDTACSSSLVAVHLACQALRQGECELALAGGVTVMATPGIFVAFDSRSAGAPDGRCKSFSAQADGAGWAEGAGMLLLERLSDARRNGHPVLAVLRGSAVNQDGRSQGLTAPNGPAQERVIRQALQSARLDPQDVDVVEAHGTGTALGDPIEAQALLSTYGEAHSADRPLWLGSLKSNVGHMQAAAGVGGIIKMVLALQHGLLPKTLHAQTPSPHIDWSAGTVRLLTEPVAWASGGHVRRAGVSSFGISGTNAHVIVEEAPAVESEAAAVPSQPLPGAWPVLLSARSEGALRAQAERLRVHVQDDEPLSLADMAYSLAATRTHFEHRASVLARDRGELVTSLESLLQGRARPDTVQGRISAEGKLAVLFPGQGSQRAAMGRGLYETFGVYREAFDAACAELDRGLERPLREVLFAPDDSPEAGRLHETAFTQPALFALEVALYRLVQSVGVKPDVLLGHSIGELVAAHVSGVLSLPDACTLVAARARLMQALPPGAMVALRASEEEVRALVAGRQARVGLAALNGPTSAVVSGDAQAVLEIARHFESMGRKTTRLRVSHAFHSPHMDGMLEEFGRVAESLRYQPARIPIVSNVTGAPASDAELGSAGYWVQHARRTVRFADGVRTLHAQGVCTFLELGPQAVLSALGQEVLSELEPQGFVATLRKGRDEADTLGAALGALHTRGVGIDWAAFFAPYAPRRVALPTYAFQRERYWLEAPRGHSKGVSTSSEETRFWQAVESQDIDTLSGALQAGEGEQRAALALVLPKLSNWKQQRRQRTTLDGWRYRVVWKPLGEGVARVHLAGTWLVVVPRLADDDLPGALTHALSQRGARVRTVRAGPEAAERDRLAVCLRDAIAEGPGLRGIVSLAALDESALPAHASVPTGLALTLALTQALGDIGVEAPLWVLTRGGVSIGRSDPIGHPRQAMTWGLGRVVALEHPGRWGGLLDVGDRIEPKMLERLLDALGREDEDQLALRPMGLWAPRMVRAPLTEALGTRPFEPRGTMLITGGTGALGAQVARWMARRGAGHLVLTSRRGAAAPGAAELRAELSALGARVTLAACDVADRPAVQDLVEQLDTQGAPVTAVVHAAGVMKRSLLEATTISELADVASAKANGAWHLHDLLGNRSLDAFVLFSSGAGVWGGAEQGAYAAANAYLDALAEHRRSLGLTATSVSWGPWDAAGMLGEAAAAELRRRGVLPMSPKLALSALAQALEHGETALTVADIDWTVFAPAFSAARARPLMRDLPEAQDALEAGTATPSGGLNALVDKLRGESEKEQLRQLESLVIGETAAVLDHADPSRIGLDRGFADLGLDSLRALELRQRLQKSTGIRLPATLTFDHPSPGQVAAFLRESLAGALTAGVHVEERGRARDGGRGACSDDPVAIVSLALRLPGGIGDLDALWTFLDQGRDAVEPIPSTRWDADISYDADPEAKGKSYVRQAAMLERVDLFDADFFGVSPREAKHVDPQHRLLLETAWQVLEEAGIVPGQLKGSATGVFVGVGPSEYARLKDGSEGAEAYSLLGTGTSFAAGRLAYTLGLQGPALSVDTACSSSLVALHLACQALRRGECDLALAAGVSVLVGPESFVLLSSTRALAPDGRSKTFSANADGYGRGEGVVVVALERLSDARARGHQVLALVRGTAVNHDGASSGITAPNGTSQQKVLRAALQDADVRASEVDVVECHGTGTSLGDPIEVQALAAVYGAGRPAEKPLLLGAIKTNIGHLEAASGLAGVAKIVASLRRCALPPTLHATPRNPHIDWATLAVSVADTARPWARHDDGTPRRAGISAFGISGTNAHVIVEEAPAVESVATVAPSQSLPAAWPVLISAKGEGALRAQARRLHDHLQGHASLPLGDLAYSLATSRTHFEHRAAVVAHDRTDLLADLQALALGQPTASTVLGKARSGGKTVFVFPGQGSQWPRMAMGLLDSSPVFRATLQACDEALAPHLDWSLMSVLRGEQGDGWLDRVEVVQPALFAMMVSLAALWRSLGVEPDAVVGHSQGEIAAAVVAEALSLQDAAKLVAVRSRALKRLAGQGAMAAVELSVEALQSHLHRYPQLSVAAINSHQATLVSGDTQALDSLVDELTAGQVFARRIRVDYASHCTQIDAVRNELLTQLSTLGPRPGKLPLYSTVTGSVLNGGELDADYWYRNLRHTVRFADSVDKLLADGHRFFVEVSPHPVLTMPLAQMVEGAPLPPLVVGSLRRDEGDLGRMLRSLTELHAGGREVDWPSWFAPYAPRRVALPTYAFDRQRYWLDSPQHGQADVVSAGQSPADHPLLAAAVALADGDGVLYTGRLSVSELPWLAEHAVFGTVILPGTAYLELALLAAERMGLEGVEELTLESPLALPPQGAVVVQMAVGARDESGRRSVRIHSRAQDAGFQGAWTRHASGTLGPGVESTSYDLRSWPPPGASEVSTQGLYETLAAAGLGYGPQFRGLRAVWKRGEELFAEAELPEAAAPEAARYAVHPALLDACLHALALQGERGGGVALPFSWSGVSVRAVGATHVRVRLQQTDSGVSLSLSDARGEPVAWVQALAMRPTSAEQLRGATAWVHDALLRVEWTELESASTAPMPDACTLLGESAFDLGPQGPSLVRYRDLADLQRALDAGSSAPALVMVPLTPTADGVAGAHRAAAQVLGLLQGWISDQRLASTRLVLLTQRAVGAGAHEDVADLGHAPVWGLVRSAQSEHHDWPLMLVDLDASEASRHALRGALGSDDRQMALREGRRLVPRIARVRSLEALTVPDAGAWRLHVATKGTFEELTLVSYPQAQAPLEPGQVRIAVHAAGLNFRDVLDTLGMRVGDVGPLGNEGAGVITEVGSGVSRLAVGDRVMGLFSAAFGPVAVADARMIARVPAGWSFVQAASVPVVFLTAYYGLQDLGQLHAGQRVLIHAAAGGVGSAAVQLARHLGAEVFATASAGKWEALRAQGFDEAHLASSRTLDFEQHFRRSTQGAGMSVVLDCLAREFVDASLRLLVRGGRFVEMGKLDVREPGAVGLAHPEVVYRAFDLIEAGPERIEQMLGELLGLFERGVLNPVPITAWDLRQAPQAMRALGQARHVGKFVLTVPRGLDPEGTVLITGGTGTLGARVARHLVAEHGVKHLLLTSRQGAEAAGAEALRSELQGGGASVTIARCDAADRTALQALLSAVPRAHPLTAVVHAAGVLDDGLLRAMTPERLDRVLGPKLDGAWHLHELTQDCDLAAFVLFSSVSGVLGAPGQSNYAAANTFLDALAHHRRAQGLAATSLAWGYWSEKSGMTAHLSAADTARIKRAGMRALTTEQGLALLDAALQRPYPALVPVLFDPVALGARAEAVHPLLRGLVRARSSRPLAAKASGAASFPQQLLSMSPPERERALLALVRTEAATVLGQASPGSLEPHRPFRELGLDSLMAVELRNRLAAATALRLHATLLFDHPTPAALVDFFTGRLVSRVAKQPAVLARPMAPEDPIAIVSMSCRFPGGVCSPEDLWRLLANGHDAIGALPDNRGWRPDALDLHNAVREGGFVNDADRFDPAFFGISPREAIALDPQQRLLLETSWEAFERAGIDPTSLYGSFTGTFVGVFDNGYSARLAVFPQSMGDLKGYFLATGSTTSVASGRIAYTYGLQGPAISMDTACSSSLVAVHLACQALRQGECKLALAGGVTVMATPAVFMAFDTKSAGAPDGRCKSFSAQADGAGWAEGAGMLLLERLSDARRNGHPVLAVLRGSAVNQDGRSQGLTAPNGPAQERVIELALASARLDPQDVDVVEAHGTGTALGDPIEAQALLSTYGEAHSADRPLWLGSLKSNVGHMQAAAGVGGIIKMVLALQHGLLPKTLHAQTPSPHIDWSAGTVRLLTEPVAWASGGHVRRAGVSSFGISGTNAHVIVEEAPAVESEAAAVPSQPLPGAWPVLLSARSEGALRAQAERLRVHVQDDEPLSLADMAYSLAATRTHFEHRASVLARDRGELVTSLESLLQGRARPDTVQGRISAEGKLAVLFPGQGSQRAAMGRGLYETFGVYREAFDAACAELDRGLERPLREVLFAPDDSPEAGRLHETAFTQPALFALEVALYRLVQSVGVKPDVLLGHSIGELVAAHVSGVLSLPDACTLVAARARLMQALPPGAMVALRASEEEVRALVAGRQARVGLAALNGPTSAVVSGDAQAVLEIARHFESMGRKTTRLRVSHAFHSPHMDGMLEEFGRVAESLRYQPARIPIVSNVTGAPASDAELGSAGYWVQHARRTVRFADGVRTLHAQGVCTFLELGPQAVLSALGQEVLSELEPQGFVATLRKGRDEADTLGAALGALHTRGVGIDWAAFFAPYAPRRVALPTYAFDRQRYWLDSPQHGQADVVSAGQSPADHPLLAAAVALADGDGVLYTGRLSVSELPWLAEHAVFGTVILPGTAYLELALLAAERMGLEGVEELTLESPLALPPQGAVVVQMAVGARDESGRRSVRIHSRAQDAGFQGAWTRHASGTLGPGVESTSYDLRSWPPPGASEVSTQGLYETLAAAGLGYGPQFRGLRAVWKRGEELFAEAELPEAAAPEAARYAVHPALLDACLHALALQGERGGGVALPFSWSGVSVRAVGATHVRVRLQQTDSGVSLSLSDARGEPVAWVQALAMRPTSAEQLRGATAWVHDALLRVEWTELESASTAPMPDACTLLGESAFDLGPQGPSLVRYRDLADLQRALDAGSSAPALVMVPLTPTADGVAGAHRAAAQVLGLLQGWISDQRLASTRLVLLTQRAVGAGAHEDVADLGHAPVWGLVRSAQSEHHDWPLMLVDLDASEASRHALRGALGSDDRQMALREGRCLVPRIARVRSLEALAVPRGFDREGTVLITGGTGTLGALVARHLVAEHGVKHLLLTSRQGAEAAGAEALRSELQGGGASVTIARCDAADRTALQALLSAVPRAHPLTAVVHAAGVLDDGLLRAMTPERLDRVLGPKLDGAWHLHELTQDCDLAAFVLFSSVSGVLGAPGQSNYAAANTFLDALAHHRRAQGLAATSLAWGYWSEKSGMTAHLSAADTARIKRAGMRALTTEQGLALLDAALQRPYPALVPVLFDPVALGARAEAVHPLLRGLVRARSSRPLAAKASGAASFPQQLLSMSPPERERALLALVNAEAAAVFGLASPGSLAPDRPFQELGLDSLMAVELRDRLAAVTGLRLSPTLLFDHPTPEALAASLLTRLHPGPSADDAPVLSSATRQANDLHTDVVRRLLNQIPIERLEQAGLLGQLLALADVSEATQTDDAKGMTSVEMEAVLPEDIQPARPHHKPTRPHHRVVLTGATGFLGAYLLHEILSTSTAEVLCFVRAATPSEGKARVMANLAKYELSAPDVAKRLSIVCADIGLPLAGLTEQEFDHLARHVDLIFHSAALLNFAMNYEDLRGPNVVGTREMLRLASRRSVPFHYISTLGVFSNLGRDRTELDWPDKTSLLRFGYVQTKAVAERLVRIAAGRGLPVSIYRPGLITGDYETGMTARDDFLAVFTSGIVQCGYAPRELLAGRGVPISPVHLVARSIARISRHSPSGKTFHLCVADDAPFGAQIDRLRARGHRIELCPYKEWLSLLYDLRQRKIRNALHSLLYRLPEDPEDLVFPEQTSSENAHASLGGPIGEPRSASAFERYLDFLVSQGLLRALRGTTPPPDEREDLGETG